MQSRNDKLRVFVIDLLYPAAVGSFIVLIFLRFANHGLAATLEAGTFFGIMFASYFALGYIKAQSESVYSPALMIFDTLSASITFAVFHSLHFSENMMSEIRDENINFQLIYIYALVAAIVPIFRRRVLREFKLLSYQTGISLAGIAVIVSGLIFRESSWCAWLGNPFLVAIFLWVLVALYGWKTLQES